MSLPSSHGLVRPGTPRVGRPFKPGAFRACWLASLLALWTWQAPAAEPASRPASASLAAPPAFGLTSAPATPPAAQPSGRVNDADVRVERDGALFRLDVVMHAPVPQALAYAVLTDFEHMASFIPNLQSSQVLSRQGPVWTVRQTGTARWGLLALAFESVRELVLDPPQEIRARSIGGSFARMDSRMQLSPEPGGTRLHYHAEGVPGDWFPPLIGPALIRHETAEQFTAMLQEMQRRQ